MKFANGTEITNLRNVRRFPDGAYILNVDIVTETDPFETVEYVARSSDIAETGQWVYQQIIEGNIDGEITDWVPPPPPSVEEVCNKIRAIRDDKLKYEVDPIVSNPLRWNILTEARQQAWIDYRSALLDLPQNPEFPWYDTVVVTDPSGSIVDISNVPWPIKPLLMG